MIAMIIIIVYHCYQYVYHCFVSMTYHDVLLVAIVDIQETPEKSWSYGEASLVFSVHWHAFLLGGSDGPSDRSKSCWGLTR